MNISAEVRAFAEVPNRTLLPSPGIDVRDDGRYLLVRGPTFAGVGALDVDSEALPAVVDEVRALLTPPVEAMWWLGPSTRPPDARKRLLALGFREPPVPQLDVMVTVAQPVAGPGHVEVTMVDTIEEFALISELRWEAFDIPADRREREAAQLEANFEANLANCAMFLARVDGRPAATGISILGERGSFLVGGCAAPWARGHGAYRALVRARWDDAVARGRPALVVHADPSTSTPILRRLGFETLFALDRLEDAR